MFARFRPAPRRLFVDLIACRRVGGQPRALYLGRLGSVALPIGVEGRARFWEEFDERLNAIAARHAGLVSAEDVDRARLRIAERIPADDGRGGAEASIYPRPEAAMAEAARRLAARARQPQPAA